jgi:hypothetical protein
MAEPDISVIVTAHAEGVLLGATLRSAEAAIARAEADGLTCERLLGLDAATETTRAIAQSPQFSEWSLHEVNLRDPFLTRNTMIGAANGRWIALVDGDDLVSENWLARGAETLQCAGDKANTTVVHPELNVIFDHHNGSFLKIAPTDPLFVPEVFYFDNYYDLMAFTPRSLHLTYPYDRRKFDAGYGFQDWQWNLKTLAAGVTHQIASDTIVFKRRRPNSISEINRGRNAVVHFVDEAMRIDKVRQLGRAPGQS